MPICEESLTSPRRHDRGHTSLVARPTTRFPRSALYAHTGHRLTQTSTSFSLTTLRHRIWRSTAQSRRDSASLEPGTQPHRRCRFCLAIYDDVTHTDQCEQGHNDTGDNSTA